MTLYKHVVSTVTTRKPVLALTFNIAAGRRVPLAVLDLLKSEGIKSSTFFVTGEWAGTNPDIVRKIIHCGYEIASHGHRHENYTEHSNAWIERDVTQSQKVIQSACGIHPAIIRTPSGDLNKRVIRKLWRMGMMIVHWGTDALDWKIKHSGQIAARVLRYAHPGDIILLHACDPWPQTIRALPHIMKGLKEKGYRFLSVSELIKYEK